MPKSGAQGGFTVTNVTPKTIDVDVDRRHVVKDTGEVKIQTNSRSISRNDFATFSRAYQKETSS